MKGGDGGREVGVLPDMVKKLEEGQVKTGWDALDILSLLLV